MQRAAVHPQDETIGVLTDDAENYLRCSLGYILQTLRRDNLFLASLLVIVLMCTIAVPVTMIFGTFDDEQLVATNTSFNLTTNTAIYTSATTNLGEFMNVTRSDTSFALDNTLDNNAD